MTHTANVGTLVTIAVVAYNQERFIREAVRSALSQDYSPLEVILSDDCSTDRTFAFMSECAADYRGPHQVVVRRNATNLGMGRHINAIAAIVQGEWIVVAAGDDVSEPDRVTRLALAWEAHGGRARAAYSGMVSISSDGESLGFEPSPPPHFTLERVVGRSQGVCGATEAVHREVFDFFGPLDREVVYEDIVLCARALLLGEIAWLEAPLVRYRLTEGGLSRDAYSKRGAARLQHHRTVATREMYAQLNVMRDLLAFASRRPEELPRAADGLFKAGFHALLNATWWNVFRAQRPVRLSARLFAYGCIWFVRSVRAWFPEWRLSREERL